MSTFTILNCNLYIGATSIFSRTQEESEILIFYEIIYLLFAGLTRLHIGGGSLPLLQESGRSREECRACPSYLSWVSP